MKRLAFNSIAFRTGILSFIGFGMVLIILVSIFIWDINKEFRNYIILDNEEQIQSVVFLLDQHFDEYQKSLQKEAGSSTLLKAVLDPLNTRYYLPDYLNGLSLRDIPGSFSLITFDGLMIYSTDPSYVRLTQYEVFMDLMRSSLEDQHISILNDSVDVGILAEVKYHGAVEGYLVFISNFKDLFRANMYFLNAHGEEHSFAAFYNNNKIIENKAINQKVLTSNHNLKTIPINIQVSAPLSIINHPVRKLLYQIIFIGIVCSFSAALLLSFFISRSMATPLKALESGIRKLSSGVGEKLSVNKKGVKELQYLEMSFNNMQDSLLNRTHQLEESYKELIQTNSTLKNTQKQLVRSEKLASIGQLAAGVAHEINNPTGFVYNNLVTMSDYVKAFAALYAEMGNLKKAIISGDEKNIRAALDRIERLETAEDFSYILDDADDLISESINGARRIGDIVQGLKNFARTDSLECKSGNVNTAIEDALRLTRNELKYKSEIDKELQDLPEISCRIDQLTQVFVNLLINAVNAIDEHGMIRIKTFLKNKSIYAEVRDTGTGIPEENLSKLFDPFFTTKEIGKGSGLGLSISHGIIEEHNGSINVESTPGKGTCITIVLPAEAGCKE